MVHGASSAGSCVSVRMEVIATRTTAPAHVSQAFVGITVKNVSVVVLVVLVVLVEEGIVVSQLLLVSLAFNLSISVSIP